MNPEAQAQLNRISDKSIPELTEEDKGFLYARRDYLGERSSRKFAEVLKEMEQRSKDKLKADKKAEKEPPQEPETSPTNEVENRAWSNHPADEQALAAEMVEPEDMDQLGDDDDEDEDEAAG